MSPRIPHHGFVPLLVGLGLIGSLVTGSSAAIVADGSFETAACSPGWFTYNPASTPWTHVDGSGVTEPPSPFGSPPPPSGFQVGFLQTRLAPPHLSAFFQSITLPAASSFTLTYLHAGRDYAGYTGNVTYEILIDSTVISSQSTVTGLPFTPVSIPFTASPGAHTLTFRLHAMTALGDNTAFFDDVDISFVPTPGGATLAGLAGALALRRRRH